MAARHFVNDFTPFVLYELLTCRKQQSGDFTCCFHHETCSYTVNLFSFFFFKYKNDLVRFMHLKICVNLHVTNITLVTCV